MSLTYRKPGAKEGKPQNEAQRLASTENFSIFLIKGMLGNLTKLKHCATVPQSSVLSIENTLKGIEKKIKHTQKQRKETKNGKA
jgi:hypothetical protein